MVEAVLVIRGGGVADALDGGDCWGTSGSLVFLEVSVCCVSLCVARARPTFFCLFFETKAVRPQIFCKKRGVMMIYISRYIYQNWY